MRLINADRFEAYCYDTVEGSYDDGVQRVLEDIDNAPTIDAIPIEWLKNKRDELEKEYYDSFYAYTDEGMNKQVWLLGDLRAFRTVLRYWEKENETN